MRNTEAETVVIGLAAPLEKDVAYLDNSIKPPVKQVVGTKGLYAVVWRWHFYAGLLTAPILWLVIITGSLYVFRHELTAWRDHALQVVEPQPQRLSYDRLREIATQELAPHEPEGLVVFPDANRSIRFVAHADEGGDGSPTQRHRRLYLNPYTGEVLGSRIEEDDFFSIVLALHRSLMMGKTGRIMTELVTSWCIILMGTGLFLWWPRGKNVGVWLPRIRGKFYAVLRDWHAVLGFYSMPLALLVAVTGLFFSSVWGDTYNNTAKTLRQWPGHWFGVPKSSVPSIETPRVSLDKVVELFISKSRPDDAILIRLAEKPDEAHRAFMMRDEDKNSLRRVSADQYTGELLDVTDVAELPLMFRIRVWAVSIHMGQIFGTPTKILAFLVTLLLLFLSVTGVWMWWKRRPSNALGFPRRPLPKSLPLWGWGVALVVGLLMPVAGAAMVVIGILDRIAFGLRSRASLS